MIDQHYLRLLAKGYPTIEAAAAEMINLKATMSLPKGTEYFFSDLHGEHEAFIHMLRSASGIIRTKIDELFEKSITEPERTALAALVYHPEQELRRLSSLDTCTDDWCRITIYRLVEVCKEVSSKSTRAQARRKMPRGFEDVIEELLHTGDSYNKSHYFNQIINTVIETGIAQELITGLCTLIGRLAVARLHIIGDIFDRGPHADAILEELTHYNVDIQWGNHDISWMGAAAGSWPLIANVLRLGISFNSFDLLEDGYGINLRPLSTFAAQVYKDDPCSVFTPRILDENKYDPVDIQLAAKMYKAMAIIQFKLEGQLIQRHPEYKMDSRLLLSKTDFKKGSVRIEGKEYPLRDTLFPTVDPNRPLALTPQEQELMLTISASFRHSERLQRHIKFLYDHGGMYLKCNDNLLYHGCIPLTEEGAFVKVELDGKQLSGQAYLDAIDAKVRAAYFAPIGSQERGDALDFLYYLWCGKHSPLFGKSKMASFERTFLEDELTHKEEMNPYYRLVEQREVCERVLREFGLDPARAHIVNGHVPVKIKQGESPVKGDGLLFLIDGGMSKAYRSQTGIGGYTLIYSSRYLALAQHKPFLHAPEDTPVEVAPSVQIVELMKRRMSVSDTDEGKELARQIQELQALLTAYRTGQIKERRS